MTSERSIVLPTADHGPVTLPEPSWCSGHAHHDPETLRVDLIHAGPAVDLVHRGATLLSAEIVQSPHASPASPYLGGRTPGVSIHPLGQTLDPTGLYCLAADLDRYADRLRDLADQLAASLGGDQ
ncbi:DUF6907 domain-containing protein [Streptomyces sp. NBC_00151]|uniref:DUF6907 domain-containing protein n=1 Tax=Streptomyces sp. NBC_00151 TaxID=2975669 RepID=UPI002DD9F96A|nr:hypothetical protein [Streptomyces sp. NBC_00151]WRZ41893.1 hypothetical protein OG915_29945 [Streptomyces sp. NBC_00151]